MAYYAEQLSDHTPAWARGAEVKTRFRTEDGTQDGHDLYRNGELVGCCYDLGAGYLWFEEQGIDDGDWDDCPEIVALLAG